MRLAHLGDLLARVDFRGSHVIQIYLNFLVSKTRCFVMSTLRPVGPVAFENSGKTTSTLKNRFGKESG